MLSQKNVMGMNAGSSISESRNALKGDNMSIKNVYAQIVSFDNLLQAEKDARAGKRYENEQLAFWGNLEDNIHSISEKLKCHDYPPDIYHHFYVYEPKLRKVIFSDYTTKVIQRAAYNVLNPIVCKGMISDTYSCIEDRGQLKSMQRLAGWVDFVEKSGERWYYLKMDVEKFFYRMDHEVLMSIIRKKIGDKEAVRFLEHYVCHASRAFGLPLGVKSPLEISDKEMLWDVGIAIGGGLSHMYGNMYLNPMDQMAKRKEGIQYYIRYMDDVIILSTDKELLHRYKNMFSDFLGDVLKLRLNNKTAIRPVSHGMEFVGYTIRPFDVRLRKSTSLRMKRHLKTIQELYRDYEIDLDRARSTLMSYKALIQVSNDDKDTDELDRLNVELMKMQLERESTETGTEDSSVSSNAINDMLEHAKSQNELYWQEFQETEENYVPVPPEVGDKMKHYKLNQLFADEASSMEIPQFMIETGRSLFSEHVQQPLSKENLYAGFSLLDKDTVIDFDSVDSEIARIDIDDSDAMPKAWKLQGFDNQNVKKWFDEQPSDRKIRLCKDMIIKKLSKNNAVNDKDLDIYVDRIIQNLTEDQLTDMEQTPGIYALKINKKVNFLLNEYAKKMFYEWVEQDKISCLPSYKLPREISPTNIIASIPKSLYSKEENFDTEYERKVVMELSSLNNIKWWHRNMARKGFAINGAVNAYPDLMVRTESGKLLLIETKGDQLENSESREKAETGAKWAEMAGRMYKYYMVFETKNPGYNGAYSYEEFMRIVKEL